jgi:ATP/maltotriose-dependent transcriptional regulator MalT
VERQLELHGERDLTPALGLPRVPRSYVPRPRLHALLDHAIEQSPVVLLVAPAVSGKSTLLAGWQATDASPPMAYVALDAFDDTVVAFWTKVLDALQELHPGCGEAARSLLGGRDTRSFLDVLLPELARLDPTVLVLDGLEALTHPTALAMLGGLLFGVTPPFRVVLSSRTEPPLRLGLLRARGQLADVHASHLAFDRLEMAEVLRHDDGPDGPLLGPDEMLVLHARTEGWVGGVRLAALALRDHPDPRTYVRSLTGHNRYLADLLATEVLGPQPPDVRDFLLVTSVLRTLDDGLCDAVTSGTGSAVLLERLERSGLFLDPIDGEQVRYRYRPLFREFLRHELHLLDPAREQAAHRAAAAELQRRGEVTTAIEHHVAGGQAGEAVALVVDNGERCAGNGQVDLLRRWLAALPDHAVAADSRQMLAIARLCLMAGMRDEAAMWLERSRVRVDATDEPALIAQHALLTGFADAHLGNLEGAVDHAERVLQVVGHDAPPSRDGHPVDGTAHADSLHGPDGSAGGLDGHGTNGTNGLNGTRLAPGTALEPSPRLREKAHHLLAAAYAGLDQFEACRRHRDAAPHDDEGEVPTDAYSSWLCYREGHLEQAVGHANRLLERNSLPWQWATPLVARGGVLRERNQLEAAALDLTRAIELSEQWARPRVFVYAAIELAQLRFAQGSRAEAFDLLAEARPRAHGVNLRQRLDVADAALWLRAGDLDRATALRREVPTSSLTGVLDARLLLVQGEVERSMALVDALESAGRTLQDRIAARLLRARALQPDDEAGATRELHRAIDLGRWEGFVQIFTEDLVEMEGLLHGWPNE